MNHIDKYATKGKQTSDWDEETWVPWTSGGGAETHLYGKANPPFHPIGDPILFPEI